MKVTFEVFKVVAMVENGLCVCKFELNKFDFIQNVTFRRTPTETPRNRVK